MKIYYLNDTKVPVRVYRDNLMSENFVKELAPAEGINVDLHHKDGDQVFVKNWGGVVLISIIQGGILE